MTGCLNTDHSQVIQFESDEDVKWVGGGQARIEESDSDGYQFLKISVLGETFLKVLVNINVPNQGGGSRTVKFTDGSTTSGAFALGNGENKFIVTGSTFSFVRYDVFLDGVAADLVDDTRQIRIGLADTPVGGGDQIPVPGTLLVFGIGFLSLWAARARQSQ